MGIVEALELQGETYVGHSLGGMVAFIAKPIERDVLLELVLARRRMPSRY